MTLNLNGSVWSKKEKKVLESIMVLVVLKVSSTIEFEHQGIYNVPQYYHVIQEYIKYKKKKIVLFICTNTRQGKSH